MVEGADSTPSGATDGNVARADSDKGVDQEIHKWETAVREYADLVDKMPTADVESQFLLGQALFELGYRRGDTTMLRQAVALLQKDQSELSVRSLASLLTARAFTALGWYSLAISCFRGLVASVDGKYDGFKSRQEAVNRLLEALYFLAEACRLSGNRDGEMEAFAALLKVDIPHRDAAERYTRLMAS